jgi:hypothetical protein
MEVKKGIEWGPALGTQPAEKAREGSSVLDVGWCVERRLMGSRQPAAVRRRGGGRQSKKQGTATWEWGSVWGNHGPARGRRNQAETKKHSVDFIFTQKISNSNKLI